jgi:hypothetical protein
VRPGDAPAQRQHRIGIDRQHPVEARAQLAPGIGRVARAECECKAVGDGVGLGVAGRVEALRRTFEPAVDDRRFTRWRYGGGVVRQDRTLRWFTASTTSG